MNIKKNNRIAVLDDDLDNELKELYESDISTLKQQVNKINLRINKAIKKKELIKNKVFSTFESQEITIESQEITIESQKRTIESLNRALSELNSTIEESKQVNLKLKEEIFRLNLKYKGAGSEIKVNPNESNHTIFIACGGSSGSHMLANLIASYEGFNTGPELNLASSSKFFGSSNVPFHLVKNSIVKPLPEYSFINSSNKSLELIPSNFITSRPYYKLDDNELVYSLVSGVKNWNEFYQRFVRYLIRTNLQTSGEVFIEHSPGNAMNLSNILDLSMDYLAIHLVRNPLDSIASMVERREKQVLFAEIPRLEKIEHTLLQWSLLNIYALKANKHKNYLLLKYEDIVTGAASLDIIFNKFNLEKLEKAKNNKRNNGLNKQSGWKLNPNSKPSTGSINRYKQSLSQSEIEFISSYRFDSEAYEWANEYSTFKKLSETLGYLI